MDDTFKPFLFFWYDSTSSRWGITQTARQCLARLPAKRVRVISVVGPMRQGKSYLMTRFAGQQKGFELGPFVTSQTKGIWAWFPTSLNPCDADELLMLMDTEGLADPRRADVTFDSHLFCLAVMLSSVLLYNFIGALNDEVFQKLELVTELCRQLAGMLVGDIASHREDLGVWTSAADGGQSKAVFPPLVLVARDSHLILPTWCASLPDYVAYLMTPQAPLSSAAAESIAITERRNSTRATLRNLFPSIEFYTIVRPVDDDDDLVRVDDLDVSELRPAFVHQAQAVIDAAMRHIATQRSSDAYDMPAGIAGFPLSPSLLLDYAQSLCDTLNERRGVDTRTLLFRTSASMNQHAVDAAMKKAQQHRKWLEMIMPVDLPRAQRLLNAAIQECGDAFASRTMHDALLFESSWELLTTQLQEWMRELLAVNARMAVCACEQQGAAAYQRLREHILADSFETMDALQRRAGVEEATHRLIAWSDGEMWGTECAAIARRTCSLMSCALECGRLQLVTRTRLAAAAAAQAQREEDAAHAARQKQEHDAAMKQLHDLQASLVQDINATKSQMEASAAAHAKAVADARTAAEVAVAKERERASSQLRALGTQHAAAFSATASSNAAALAAQATRNAAELAARR